MVGIKHLLLITSLVAGIVPLVFGVAPQQVVRGSGQANERFGAAVAVDGETVVVGAPGNAMLGPDAGRVYVYRFDAGQGWTKEIELVGDDTKGGDAFGTAVAVDGSRVLVGAPGADPTQSGAGAAYVFARDLQGRWAQTAVLVANDAALNDRLGEAVALDGVFAVAGAPGEDTGGSGAGAAYVFANTTAQGWRQQGRLKADVIQADAAFGAALAVRGDALVVGAPLADEPRGANAGLAYFFQRSGLQWIQVALFTAGDAAFEDRFGTSVALRPDFVLVGAPGDDERGGMNAGAAYIFEREEEQWLQRVKLTASDARASAAFGQSVSLNARYAIAGAPRDNGATFAGGASYAYTEPTPDLWQEVTRRVPEPLGRGAGFGQSTALSDQYAVIGAPFSDEQVVDGGTVYIYPIETYITARDRVVTQHEIMHISAYPNPFSEATALTLALPESRWVRLHVYNSMGQRVAVLVDGHQTSGSHTIPWTPSDLAPGVYWMRLETTAHVQHRAVIFAP